MESRPRPVTVALGVAAAVLALEALAALAFGIAEATHITLSRIVVGAGAALLLGVYAAVLAALARGLWLGRPWSRGPVVALQLVQLPVAWSFRGGSTTWVAVLLAGASLVALVCVLLPTSTTVLTAGRELPRGRGDR